jgi:tetratricopeptide (TPR) repeat protein
MARLLKFLFPLTLIGSLHAVAHPGAHSAIEHFSRQIEQHPDNQVLFIQRGTAYSNDGQYEKALADLQAATRLGEPIAVSFELGVLHYRMGEMATARQYFDEYLNRFPDHAASLEYRARLLRDSGDYAASIRDFKRFFALQERPNPGHYISVAKMLETSGDQGIARALDILDTGNEKLGVTPQVQQHAIKLELQRGRPELAVARLETLEPMLGESPDWKVDMGAALFLNQQPDQARQMLSAAASQLEGLRATPARLKLKQRIKELEYDYRPSAHQSTNEVGAEP